MLPVIYSQEFLEHKTGRYHPEKPERLTAIVNALKQAAFAEKITWQSPTSASHQPSLMSVLLKAHDPAYINKVKEIATTGGGYLDGDTPISPRSYDVALLAVSAWLDGVNAVLTSANPAFVLARPPGHHAESGAGMGFCLFSHAAIAALYALEQPGVNKVAILDWDVHHGNGTQSIVETYAQIAYCSLHQYPCYPGSGKASEQGFYDNVLNLPVAAGSDITVYQPLIENKVIPFLAKFKADLLIVSAGYDANQSDPLASINLKPEDYGLFTDSCLGLTRKILFGLEGGYDFTSLSQSVLATIERCFI
ncbi:histone deacetylase family protein [Umezakia ovalisporum]|jgi:acetoin utilization deacetylase AcuC-like enzyme|uniref:Histone deacetylase n=2 Tax=Umezakia ovalisporum TaxID=75695 RepID=A0AA43H2Z7_9CYAN|nr:histone deacetylase [Umezakia ovalisporum]MBI1242173.1 histone deacetylase [Nostoc sp. RI_552]MDH6056221.1 histone deacetylase [Umezakia ovalisporum FSS-43]MDH6065643.1 histone deacetylase [Umezakia ovalisporum FSS-62]MDH6065888.1 histone deacetylase [Umezakia ovalisporum APH033B]MDH6072086.1 histone deacetylase [Umezakia ovalisporum CobakiLakeA]